MSGSKKFYISMLSIITFVCVLLGITFCVRHAYGNVVDPTPDNPTPDTELACVFDRDWFEQISGMAIEVPDSSTGASKTETITKESINHISFGKTSTGTYLGKTTSGIDVYYTRSDDGKYSLDFVSDKTISAPTNCDNLFSGCSSLTGMDFSNFDTTPATSSNDMFSGCNSFNSVTGSSNYGLGNLPSSTTGKSDMNETIASETATNLGINQNTISKISFLQASDKTYLTTLNSGIVTYYSQAEDGNFELDFVAHKIYAPENCEDLFNDFNALTAIDFTNFDTRNVTNMCGMFAFCESLTDVDVTKFDTHNVTDMHSMFLDCMNLSNIDLSSFNTSNVTNMQSMFSGCRKLTSLELIYLEDWFYFDTSKVTDMSGMFSNCESFYSLDLSTFDTSNVTNMSGMFSGCKNLSSNLDISSFDTHNVTDMHNMFSNCRNIMLLNLSNFDTSKVTDMRYMFYNCKNLTDLDVTNFNTSQVTDMEAMFSNSGVDNLDLSNFDTRNVTSYDYMFLDCNRLYNFTIGENYTLDNLYFSVKFYVNDELVSEQTIALNHTAEPVDVLAPDGYKFVRWTIRDDPWGGIENISVFSIRQNYIFDAVLELAGATISYDDAMSAYVVSGYDAETLSASLTIPSTFNDGVHGIANVVEIEDEAFKKCTILTSIVIPDSVVFIGESAFRGCPNLTSVVLPDTIICLLYGTFCNCNNLVNINFPNDLCVIGGRCFSGCESLTNIELPNSVYNIGEYAFNGCIGLTNVIFENTTGWSINGENIDVTDSEANAKNLRGTYKSYSWTRTDSIDYTQYLKLAYDTTTAGYYVVAITDKLPGGSLIIPSTYDDGENGTANVVGITSFGGGNETSITSVTIPASVIVMKASAFANCTNLESVIFENTENWKVTKNLLTKIAVDVTDSAKNVEYLTNTYSEYSWIVSE